MSGIRWVIIVLAFISAGWLAFDGAHALVTGDYVTPRSGPHAGQLGPWSKLFTAMGLDPRSLFIRWLHLFIGTAWLGAIGSFACRVRRAWGAMVLCAVAGLWYLPFGTLISLIVIGMLMLPGVRRQYVR
jgi:hypothetical protein